MVNLPNSPFDLQAIYDFASSQEAGYWIFQGVDIILSTIVGGIILLILLETIGRKFGGTPSNVHHVFMIPLIINIVIKLGIMGIVFPVLFFIPFVGGFLTLIIQPLIWIIFIKIFFRETTILSAVLIGVLGYLITTNVAFYVLGMFSSAFL